ncbi:MAG: threonine ammonia-lyase IlvA [Hyphomicrobiaceae bacterium]|nr:threonine ammonia-lyase IlvA [Hyphomicrobiaceae bacterium]
MKKQTKTSFLNDVEAATTALRDVLDVTPLQCNEFLSDRTKARIWLKREDLTPVRSYKLRGAYNFFRKALLKDPKNKRFVCASAGNHAQGFAFACQKFKVDGVVFMPVTTPQQKINKTRVFGADRVRIELIGDIFDESNQAALDYAKVKGAMMVPPFDHPDIIEGQASVGVEILEQIDGAIDILVIPVGGGGLSAGLTQVFAERSPDTRIIYVEPEGAPSFKRSLEAGRRVTLNEVDSFVDGAAVAQIGSNNFKCLKHVDSKAVHLISEDHLCTTMVEMLNVEGVVLEPAGALAVEALKGLSVRELKGKRVVCVTSGGNFDFARFPEVKERAMKAEGRKKYFIIRMPQRPGALREFLELFGPEDDVARFEYLKKSARNFGSILLGVETKNAKNFDQLMKKMRDAGIHYEDITDEELIANFVI